MIAHVIPAKRMPLSFPFFDYTVSEPDQSRIKIGQLVKIPFRNTEEFGIVYEIDTQTPIKTKPLKTISSIVFEQPLLHKQQLDFLTEISDFYHVSLGFLIKTNLPPLQKRKLEKLKSVIATHNITTTPVGTISKPQLCMYRTPTEKTDTLIKKITEHTNQTLILVPEMSAIKKITDILPSEIVEKLSIITSELNPKELFAAWFAIWSGEKKIIIGTRAALFLPWQNLEHIILDDEGNPNYKSWDMAPRLHTRDAALFLAKNHRAHTTLLTHTPAVETLFFAQKKVYNCTELNLLPIAKPLQLIDMRAQRRLKNFSLFSHDLLEEFKNTPHGDIFFFINRRGTVSYVGCRDCSAVLQCPTCHFSLTYHQHTNQLSCHYCQHTEPMPIECRTCHGVNVAMYGAGTQLAEDLVKKIISKTDTRAIIRIDSDENDIPKLKLPGDKIIIGTQLAWAHLDWKKIKLCAFLDADSSLFIPEYKIVENLWQQIRDAQFNLPADAILVAQTNHPEHLVFTTLFDPNSFYTQQLSERRLLGYPPFKFLVKMAQGIPNQQESVSEAQKIIEKITHLTKNNPDITILGPWETAPAYYHGNYWQVILAKISYENYKKNTKLLLTELPDTWKIDPNPNSILSFS